MMIGRKVRSLGAGSVDIRRIGTCFHVVYASRATSCQCTQRQSKGKESQLGTSAATNRGGTGQAEGARVGVLRQTLVEIVQYVMCIASIW